MLWLLDPNFREKYNINPPVEERPARWAFECLANPGYLAPVRQYLEGVFLRVWVLKRAAGSGS